MLMDFNVTMKTYQTTEAANNSSTDFKIPFSILTGCKVLNAFLITGTIYIFACLVIYGVKKQKWKQKPGASNLNRGVIYTTCILAVVLLLPRLIANAILMNLPIIPGGLETCELIFDITNGAFSVSIYAVYFFLWLRQKIIYSQPSVNEMAGKFVSPIGWIAMILFTPMCIGISCVYTIPYSYTSLPYGCVINSEANFTDIENFFGNTGSYFLGGLLIVAQLTLLGLFIYPLMLNDSTTRRHKNICNSGSKDSNTATRLDKRLKNSILTCFQVILGRKNTNTVLRTIHRSMICCAITVLSDICTMAIVSVIPGENIFIPRILPTTLYDISLMINVFCIIATFQNTGEIFKIPFKRMITRIKKRSVTTSDDSNNAMSQPIGESDK
ncbi:uncharacterized protein LOC144424239 [Styela clava]